MSRYDGAVPKKRRDQPSLALDDQLCFALYAASRAVTSYYRPLLDDLGLTYPQYLVLLVLWESGEVTVKEVGAKLYLDYGTLSPLLKRLETAGLVKRTRCADDERSVTVSLTDRGEALRTEASCVPAAIQAAMALDDRELVRVREAVQAVATAVRDAPSAREADG